MPAKKYRYLLVVIAVAVAATAVFLGRSSVITEKTHKVASGSFELTVSSKGEIQGKNAVVIDIPDELRRRDLRIYELKIKDMVQEGTRVKKGDWIATLDAATITEQIQNNKQELDKRRAELNDAKIDSTIQLTQLRQELHEFEYDLEYQKLELEQAKYESPAYQRKQQMQYNKILRQYDKKKRDYELKKLDLKMRTLRIQNWHDELQAKDSLLNRGMAATRVTAPRAGMVMYAKLWGGRKLRPGDNVNIWNPAIATLPDMSVLVSETYIQEIDITKIALGDSVQVKIDALPGKTYKGMVSKIANIGQEINGFDTKVFRVFIDLLEQNREIKPAMTTENIIVTDFLPDVVKIPRKCLFSGNGESYVYLMKEGTLWKKKVVPGLENEEEVVIESGLQPGDVIMQAIPKDTDDILYYAER